MAIVNILGGYDFTVSGVTVTPTAGATYTNNGVTFTVKSTTISAGAGDIMTTCAGAPLTSGTLTKVTGVGDATITFSSSYNAQHLGDVTYATGDTLSVLNTSNVFTRLLVDAQNANDVTKVESTLIGIFSMNANGEILFKNTSTTTPLIVKISGEQSHTLSGNKSIFKTRGDWISLGTGTGLNNQTISVASVGGKLIDWPPYVEVETSAGSGVYVKMLNIGGNYLDGYAGSGLVATAYPFKKTFADCGSTIDNGHFFEFDEQNSTIHFGGATGGWIPPSGANIRINNIHFTGTLRPNSVATSRNRFVSVAGVFDLQNTSFSNRWGVGASQFWPQSIIIRDVGMLTGSSPANVNGTIDIDGLVNPLDLYTNARPVISFSFCNGPFSVSNYWGCSIAASPVSFLAVSNVITIGELRMTLFSKTSAFQYGISLTNCLATGGDDSPADIGPFYSNGGSMNFVNSMNLRLYGYYFSDTSNGVASVTNTMSWITFLQGNVNVTIQKLRLLNGGCPSNSFVLSSFVNPSKNVAIHDVVIDGKNPQTLAMWQKGFSNDFVERKWMTNFSLTNFVTTTNSGALQVATGAPFTYPVRFCDIEANHAVAQSLTVFSGMFLEGVTTGINASMGVYDVSPAHLLRTTGKTVGTLYLYPGVINQKASQISFSGGVDGVDYYITNQLVLPGSGVTVTYTPVYRIRAVTGVSSATMSITGVTPTSGTTFNLRLRPYGQDTWGSYRAISTVADFQAEFNAMTGYNSDDGFEIQWQIISSTNVPARTLTSIQFALLDLDGTWVAPEVGYIQVGYTGATPGATAGVLDNTTPASPSLVAHTIVDASGEYKFDYPYAFDGTSTAFKIVSRSSGYSEGTASATSHQAGKTVPVSQTLNYATTDADIDAANLAINGTAKTFTVTASHTMLELYQRAQWWSHQPDNLIYDIPLTTTSGTNFIQASGWNLLGPSYLTGGGTITGGTVTLDGPATYSTAFSGATVVSQGEGTYNMNVTSSIITFAPTASAVNYNLGSSTFSGTIDLRNTHATRTITVQLPTGTSYTTANNTGGTITVTTPSVYQSVTVTGLTANSRIQIYDTTNSLELYNDVVAGTSYTWTDTVAASASRGIRLRVAYVTSTTANTFIDTNIGTCGVLSSDAGISYFVSPTVNSVYVANLIDGSAITDCSITGTNLFVGIDTGSTSWQHIYAFMTYWLYTSGGIRDQYLEMVATDQTNYIFLTAHGSFKIKNITAPSVPLLITGGNAAPDTGSVTDILDTTGGTIFCIEKTVVPFTVYSGSGVTPSDIISIKNAVWDEPVSSHTTSGTIGKKIGSELLTTNKFIALK